MQYLALLIIITLWDSTNTSFAAGFNVETVEYKNISFTVWDVGGQDKVFTPPASSCPTSDIIVYLVMGDLANCLKCFCWFYGVIIVTDTLVALLCISRGLHSKTEFSWVSFNGESMDAHLMYSSKLIYRRDSKSVCCFEVQVINFVIVPYMGWVVGPYFGISLIVLTHSRSGVFVTYQGIESYLTN